MTSIDFMDSDEPNFIWKGRNALMDMGCIIESELPEVSANKRYETYSVVGRSGEFHETFDDYESYDYEIKDITILRERLAEIKSWLSGRSRLITHNDQDKYRDCICTMSKPIEFDNEWGMFYTFSVSFRSQPFRRKIRETPIDFATRKTKSYDPGQQKSSPYHEGQSSGGEINLSIGSRKLVVLNSLAALVTVDCENGKVMQEGLPLFTKGEWLKCYPGENELTASGAVESGKIWNRSVWL